MKIHIISNDPFKNNSNGAAWGVYIGHYSKADDEGIVEISGRLPNIQAGEAIYSLGYKHGFVVTEITERRNHINVDPKKEPKSYFRGKAKRFFWPKFVGEFGEDLKRADEKVYNMLEAKIRKTEKEA